jgi:hypothetical protein
MYEASSSSYSTSPSSTPSASRPRLLARRLPSCPSREARAAEVREERPEVQALLPPVFEPQASALKTCGRVMCRSAVNCLPAAG